MTFIQIIGNYYSEGSGAEFLDDSGFVNIDCMRYVSVGIEKIEDQYLVLLHTEDPGVDGVCECWITGRYPNMADAILGTQFVHNKITSEKPTGKSFRLISKHFDAEHRHESDN